MRSVGMVAAVTIAVIGAAAAVGAQSIPAGYTVTLHCDGRSISLVPAAVPAIYSWALRFVRSSEKNSQGTNWKFPAEEVEQEYRDALAGDYLRVDFASLATIANHNGVVYASALLTGLDPENSNWRSKYPDHFEDSLFTIDEHGTVIGYALYSGLDDTALFRTIEKAMTDAGACKRAEGLFFQDAQLPAFLRDFLKENNLQD